MLANRVLIGSAVLVLVTMAFFYGIVAAAPATLPHQAPAPDGCQAFLQQHFGSVLSGMSVAGENAVCADLGLQAGIQAPTTGGILPTYSDNPTIMDPRGDHVCWAGMCGWQ